MKRALLYLFSLATIISANDLSAADLIFKRNSELISFSKNKANLPIILDVFPSTNFVITNEKLIDKKKFSRNQIENIKISPGKYLIQLKVEGVKKISEYLLEVSEHDKEIFIELFQNKHNKKYLKKYNLIKKNSALIKTSSGYINAIVSSHSEYKKSDSYNQSIKELPKKENPKLQVKKSINEGDPLQKLSELKDLYEAGLVSEEVYSRMQKKYLEQIL